MKSILVTGIGGGVGQGVLRNLRAMQLVNPIVGVNVNLISAGNHLCDIVETVPYAYDPKYLEKIHFLINKHNIACIIPTTDYEVYYLGLYEKHISAVVAASPPEVSKMCLDKYLTYQNFKKYGLPFASSHLPSEYAGQFRRNVAKPREGRGSRNIFVDHSEPSKLSDDYVIQEYLDGPEITTAVYVCKNGEFHGSITMVRDLEQGNTSRCQVVFDYDDELFVIINNILRHFNFRGSFNIQSRITAGGIIPFEINCRISGTNSIRSQFGFKDVEYTVQDFFFGKKPKQPEVVSGCAIRIMHDIIYPGIKLSDVRNKNDQHWIY